MDTWSDVWILLFMLPRDWWLFCHAIPCYCVSYLLVFSFCLSRLLTQSCFVVSPFVGCRQGNNFFLFPLWLFFLRHPLLTPSLTLFLPNALESPTTFIHPLHLCLHSLAFLPVRSIKPLDRERENVNNYHKTSIYCVISISQK